MELQPLLTLKEAAASMAIEWFRKMAEERVLDHDAVARIDVAFKVHTTVCQELQFLGFKHDVADWQEEILSIAQSIQDVSIEHGCPDDRLADAMVRLHDLVGKGGAA